MAMAVGLAAAHPPPQRSIAWMETAVKTLHLPLHRWSARLGHGLFPYTPVPRISYLSFFSVSYFPRHSTHSQR